MSSQEEKINDLIEEDFGEQFPSLKDKYIWTVINIVFIQEHCLDKQKVRDAIDKIMLECCSTSAEYVCNKLKERLGL